MATVLDLLALAVLLFIAAELYVISRELGRLAKSLPAARETKEGQTINVNLGQLPVAAIAAEAPKVEEAPAEAEAAAPVEAPAPVAEPEPEPEPEAPPPRPLVTLGARPTTSGLLALKCPNCQAENSNYRSECFNCGTRL
jgi:outer membrane biosynthesis protein TonB